jgi:transposase-like protein
MSGSKQPSLDVLGQYVEAGATLQTIADSFGVSPSSAAQWVAEYKTSVGKSKKQLAAKAKRKAKAELDAIDVEMLDLALANVRDTVQWAGSASDLAKHTRLCLEIRAAVVEAKASAGGDETQADRPELLDRVRKATASAAKLRVVKDPTG